MEPRTGAENDLDRLPFANQPVRVLVERDRHGMPRTIWMDITSRRRQRVERIVDAWAVEEGWWTEHPVDRLYVRCALASGRILTVFRDCPTNTWWMQKY